MRKLAVGSPLFQVQVGYGFESDTLWSHHFARLRLCRKPNERPLAEKVCDGLFSLRQRRLLGDRAQPDLLRGAEPRNDVFLSLKGCCFPGSKKNDVLTEAKRVNSAFRGYMNKVHDEVVQLCVEHKTVGQCQCKARCDHPMLTLSTARRQQATGKICRSTLLRRKFRFEEIQRGGPLLPQLRRSACLLETSGQSLPSRRMHCG